MGQIKITQVRSSIKRPRAQKRTLEALGLRGIGKTVTKTESASILGMVNAIKHLVSIEKDI